jgi:hypothetical protein
MVLKKQNGKDYPAKNLSDLFTSDKRKLRNELFGSYLSKTYVPETILDNVGNKIKEIRRYLTNLETLNEELQKLVAEEKAKKMLADVEKMSDADAQALLVQLKAKLGQQ